MPGPPVPFEALHICYHVYPQWVQVNIPDELQEVLVLLTDYGLVPVLKEMAAPIMPQVEGHGMPSQKPSHESRELDPSRTEQKVDMIRHQSPGITARLGLLQQRGQTFNERVPVFVVHENIATLDTSGDNVMEKSGNVDSSRTWHGYLGSYII